MYCSWFKKLLWRCHRKLCVAASRHQRRPHALTRGTLMIYDIYSSALIIHYNSDRSGGVLTINLFSFIVCCNDSGLSPRSPPALCAAVAFVPLENLKGANWIHFRGKYINHRTGWEVAPVPFRIRIKPRSEHRVLRLPWILSHISRVWGRTEDPPCARLTVKAISTHSPGLQDFKRPPNPQKQRAESVRECNAF